MVDKNIRWIATSDFLAPAWCGGITILQHPRHRRPLLPSLSLLLTSTFLLLFLIALYLLPVII